MDSVTRMSKRSLYERALKQWGKQFQLIMFAEEFSELFKLLSHKIRHIKKGPSYNKLAEEFADMEIMLEQMQVMAGVKEVSIKEIKEKKLERLKDLLEAYE